MIQRWFRILVVLLSSGVLVTHAPAIADDAQPTPEQAEFFEAKVRPLLVERCHQCHGPEEQEAGLRLDSRARLLKGGDTGPAVVPGHPEQSELVRAVRYDPDGYQMPPDGKLPAAEIDILTRWVEMGVPWPGDDGQGAVEVESFDLEARAERWSFQPLTKPALPTVSGSSWCRNPIDRFLLAKLEANRLSPADAADRETLLRRAFFDVVGLPPSPEQVVSFASDDSPVGYERLIDELLSSPHFGVRWGRHWLDLVRYAESRGHEFDFDVANAWQYRDYIVRAINDDVPYDQLVVEHVAGDLLASSGFQPGDEEQCVSEDSGGRPPAARFSLRLHPQTGANESILGTGFWFLGEWVHSPVDIRGDEAERFANMIDVYSKTFLGLTVACARCHDHKFDPITTKDFYALQGYLQSSHYRQARFETLEHNRQLAAASKELFRKAQQEILPVYQKLARTAAQDLDKYLLAARDLFGANDARPAEAIDELVPPLAQSRKLDPVVLAEWVRHLRIAAGDVNDPFHLWGMVCCEDLSDLTSIQAYVAQRSERELSAEGSFYQQAERVPELTVDSSFLVGDVLALEDDPARPYVRFETNVVRRNPVMTGLKPASSSDAEPGAAGHHRSHGAVVCTDTFEITCDRICVRVRGDCSLYVGVDSHILIKGPLHGGLFSSHSAPEGQNEQWRWITVDVGRYRGHRAHLEVLPHAGRPFSLGGIWQSDEAPPVEQERSWADNKSLATMESMEALARNLARSFEEMECLESHFVLQADDELRSNCLLDAADWLIRHPALFGLDRPASRREIAAVAKPFVQQMRQLKDRVQVTSALAPTIGDGSTEREYVFIRGNWKKPGELVAPAFLEVFEGDNLPAPMHGSGRLDLARHMVDPAKTPILPRVIVNRIWQHYFGVGIVPTSDDFGYMGQDPSHPELLDWLAAELVENDWSMKHIHRLILTSSAYRMSSSTEAESMMVDRQANDQTGAFDPQLSIPSPAEIDPENRLLRRMNVKRLEGEAIRDAILSISGRLDPQLAGKSVPVHLTPFMEGRGRPSESGPVDGAGRRSLYISVRRNFPDPFFQAFDMPNPHTTTGRRSVSNVPAQALAMMNNPFVVQQSERWAARLLSDLTLGTQERIRAAYLACLSREPSEQEMATALSFLTNDTPPRASGVPSAEDWGSFCHVLFNTKEFLFVR